jgi:phosphatidylserine decarboxylase
MRIAREGYPLIFTFGALTMIALALGCIWFGIGLAIVTLAVTGFFRDPERTIPQGDNLVVAPADGKVVSIAPSMDKGIFKDAATRISIFLSPLDVHINRTPLGGEVATVSYKPGSFMAAYKDDASERNEQNALTIVNGSGRRVGVVQVAGVVARRIVCRVRQGDRLARGERFGLIMFGSRTDTYLPQGCSVEVTEGQRVKGGETVIGRFQ